MKRLIAMLMIAALAIPAMGAQWFVDGTTGVDATMDGKQSYVGQYTGITVNSSGLTAGSPVTITKTAQDFSASVGKVLYIAGGSGRVGWVQIDAAPTVGTATGIIFGETSNLTSVESNVSTGTGPENKISTAIADATSSGTHTINIAAGNYADNISWNKGSGVDGILRGVSTDRSAVVLYSNSAAAASVVDHRNTGSLTIKDLTINGVADAGVTGSVDVVQVALVVMVLNTSGITCTIDNCSLIGKLGVTTLYKYNGLVGYTWQAGDVAVIGGTSYPILSHPTDCLEIEGHLTSTTSSGTIQRDGSNIVTLTDFSTYQLPGVTMRYGSQTAVAIIKNSTINTAGSCYEDYPAAGGLSVEADTCTLTSQWGHGVSVYGGATDNVRVHHCTIQTATATSVTTKSGVDGRSNVATASYFDVHNNTIQASYYGAYAYQYYDTVNISNNVVHMVAPSTHEDGIVVGNPTWKIGSTEAGKLIGRVTVNGNTVINDTTYAESDCIMILCWAGAVECSNNTVRGATSGLMILGDVVHCTYNRSYSIGNTNHVDTSLDETTGGARIAGRRVTFDHNTVAVTRGNAALIGGESIYCKDATTDSGDPYSTFSSAALNDYVWTKGDSATIGSTAYEVVSGGAGVAKINAKVTSTSDVFVYHTVSDSTVINNIFVQGTSGDQTRAIVKFLNPPGGISRTIIDYNTYWTGLTNLDTGTPPAATLFTIGSTDYPFTETGFTNAKAAWDTLFSGTSWAVQDAHSLRVDPGVTPAKAAEGNFSANGNAIRAASDGSNIGAWQSSGTGGGLYLNPKK